MKNSLRTIDWRKAAKRVAPFMVVAIVFAIGCFLSMSGYNCDVWSKAETTSKDVYTNVRNLSTYVAGAMFVIALLFALFSKDQRKVDMALDWAKRIFVIWLVILGAGFIFEWGRNLMADAPGIFG